LNGRPVEVLNLGVGGYSTADEALVLRHKVARWKPDFVTVGYFLNDPEIDPIQPLHAHFAPVAWWRHSHLARLVAQALVNYKVKEWGGGDYYRYLHYPQGDKWRSVVEGFGEIAAFSRESRIPVLLVIFPAFPPDKWDGYRYADIHQQVADAARAAGLEVLDLLPVYRQTAQPAKLWAAKNDDHPSVLGHRIAANAILAKMRAMLAGGDGLNSARGAK
jgi:hypothetical protein